MKKELDYVDIEGSPGGNQDWLPEWDMNRGGCAAVTACDLCIYLAGRDNFPALYPYDLKHLNREDFIRFAGDMKPCLTPRYHGIDFLEIYLCGLSEYWRSVKYNRMRLEGLSGVVPFETVEPVVRSQLDAGIPVPCLLLNHRDPELEDLEWHWFNLAGYERPEYENEKPENEKEKTDDLLVKVVTYGEAQWFSLKRLWDTGQERRGGIIRVFQSQRTGV